MAHRGIILLLIIAPMLVAAAMGSGSKMEHAKDSWDSGRGGEVTRREGEGPVVGRLGTYRGVPVGSSHQPAGGKYATGKKDKVVESAARAYQEAEHKVGEAYEKAKNTASEKTKSKYEAAKEELSDAAGKLGAAMGAGGEEL